MRENVKTVLSDAILCALGIAACGFAFFLFSVWFSSPSYAHDPYNGIQRPNGQGSCCSGRDEANGDCYALEPHEVRFTPNGWEVLINQKWHPVPNETILIRRIKGGGTHVCFNGQILCFIRDESGQ